MTYEIRALIPLILSILTSIGWGLYHRIRVNRSGQIIERFNHRVFHKGEKLSYLVIGPALYALVWYYQEHLIYLSTLVILGMISKAKMSQDIMVTEEGVLIRGIFKKWSAIKSVKILETGHVEVICKNTSFEITDMENKEAFINLSKTYIVTEWFYAEEE